LLVVALCFCKVSGSWPVPSERLALQELEPLGWELWSAETEAVELIIGRAQFFLAAPGHQVAQQRAEGSSSSGQSLNLRYDALCGMALTAGD
jgi:hypothetical protein